MQLGCAARGGRAHVAPCLFAEPARRIRLVVAERIELVGAMEKALDGCARDHRIRAREQDRLPQLMVQGRTLTVSPLLPSNAPVRMKSRCVRKSIERVRSTACTPS